MHPYIPYLLEDIQSAELPDGPLEISYSLTFEDEMEAIDPWVSGENEPEYTFSYYCGLQTEQFPPPELLKDKEIILVCKAFEHLLFTWNSRIDLPDILPLPLRYQFMVKTLQEGFTLVNSGFMTYDYCSGYAPDCVLGKYCKCLEYWNKESKD